MNNKITTLSEDLDHLECLVSVMQCEQLADALAGLTRLIAEVNGLPKESQPPASAVDVLVELENAIEVERADLAEAAQLAREVLSRLRAV